MSGGIPRFVTRPRMHRRAAWLVMFTLAILGWAPSARATTIHLVKGLAVTAMSCSDAAAQDCDALAFLQPNSDQDFSLIQITGGVPGTQIPLPDTLDATTLACSSPNTCLVAGSVGLTGPAELISVTDGRVAPAQTLSDIGINAIACPTAGECLAAGSSGGKAAVAPIVDGAVGAVQTASGPAQYFKAISCSDATHCAAVGGDQVSSGGCGDGCSVQVSAVVDEITNGVPGPVHTIAGSDAFLFGVGCPAASTHCVAVGNIQANGQVKGILVPVDDGVPGTTTPVPGTTALQAVSCPTPVACLAVGGAADSISGALVPVSSGGALGATRTLDDTHLTAIDCASLTDCTAAGGYSVTDGSVLSIGSPQVGVGPSSTAAALTVALEVGGSKASIPSILKGDGYDTTFVAPGPGTATLRWYDVPSRAHLAAQAQAPQLIASGSRRFTAKGAGSVMLRLTSAGRARLKDASRLQLTAIGSFTSAGAGAAVTARRTFTLTVH